MRGTGRQLDPSQRKRTPPLAVQHTHHALAYAEYLLGRKKTIAGRGGDIQQGRQETALYFTQIMNNRQPQYWL
jgi:hypothetical protein